MNIKGTYKDLQCNEDRSFKISDLVKDNTTSNPKCVVYAIKAKNKNLESGVPCIYIGSSLNYLKRSKIHLRYLLKGKHQNIKLQRFYDKHGIDELEFTVLEETTPKNIRSREQNWMDFYRWKYGNKVLFNIASKVDKPLFGKAPWNKGKKSTKEQIDRLVEASSKHYKLLSPTGEYVEVFNMAKFSRDNGLCPQSLSYIVTGKHRQHRGWTSYEHIEYWKNIPVKPSGVPKKIFKILSPDNAIIEFCGLRAFCRENNLDHSVLKKVLDGKFIQHRGWRRCE